MESKTDCISINNLPDDCLLHIFHFLDVENRLRSSTACRRWRDLKFVTWRDMKKLDLVTIDKSRTPHPRLLQLCGRFLTDLTIPVPKDSNIIRVVSANCPNLIKLSVQFQYCRHDKAEHCADLARLFAGKKKKLRSIVIDNMGEEFIGDCLLKLPKQLVELQLWGFMAHLERNSRKRSQSILPFVSIIPVLQRLPDLQILVLNGLIISEDEMEMIKTLKNLRYLEIFGNRSPGFDYILDFDSISASHRLEFLSLQSLLSTSDLWVEELVENNPDLKHLKLTQTYLSEEAQEKLFQLSKLETLSLKSCLCDYNFRLSGFLNLRKLMVTRIRDPEIIGLMDTALRLEFVEVDGCLNSPRVLKKAYQVATRRDNNLYLHIVVPCHLIKQWRRPKGTCLLLIVESLENYRARTEEKYEGYDVGKFY